MKRPVKSTVRYAIEATTRLTLSAAIAMLTLLMPATVLAQASVTLQQDATVYRAFYYDASDTLLHVEVVRNVGGRYLTPLFSAPPAAPAEPPLEGPLVFVGPNARYAIYYGTSGPNQPKFQSNDPNAPSKPVAFERLSAADQFRPIECAVKGADACLFPKMCHCSVVGGCCCY